MFLKDRFFSLFTKKLTGFSFSISVAVFVGLFQYSGCSFFGFVISSLLSFLPLQSAFSIFYFYLGLIGLELIEVGIKRVTFNYSTPTVSFLFKTVKFLDKNLLTYTKVEGDVCLLK